MKHAVFYHRADTVYNDIPSKQYHFPSRYLSRVEITVGSHIVYYGPISSEKSRYYWSVAKVMSIRKDEASPKHYYAMMSEYIDFDTLVDYRADGGFEKKLVMPDGSINGGTSQQAVRIIDENTFSRIIEAGLSKEDSWPDRDEETEEFSGFEEAQAGYRPPLGAENQRPLIQQLVTRKFRDRKFKSIVRNAYDRRCAFTGLRLINGKGRPEVEAAHIMPVKDDGPDSIQNGIALSGTVHWMFDRGLLSLSDNHDILLSRQLNYDVGNLLTPDLKALVPTNKRLAPHPYFLNWHRENIFKQ